MHACIINLFKDARLPSGPMSPITVFITIFLLLECTKLSCTLSTTCIYTTCMHIYLATACTVHCMVQWNPYIAATLGNNILAVIIIGVAFIEGLFCTQTVHLGPDHV